MLQPRRAFWLILVLVAITSSLTTDVAEDLLNNKLRIKRNTDGDVTVLSLEENGRLRESPLGIISSTARTFVNDGATTEFATQIIGTTVGRTYARLLSTGTRVYYDSNRHTKDPFLVFPSLPGVILPTRTPVQIHTAEPVLVAQEKPISLNEIAESVGTEKPEQPVVSVRKEFSVKRNTEIKPAKVKPKSDLPTVTIKNEFSPSGYSSDLMEEKKEDKKPRGGKGLFRGGVQVKNDFQKYDTVTYVGFADFTTTVGNTIIIFMPKTVSHNSGPVTSISGAATLRPEDVSMPVVTSVKTFMSHSPGMATKTVNGHKINMETSLPTIQGDIRASKAYNPVFSTASVSDLLTTEEPLTNAPTTNQPTTNQPTTNPPTTNQQAITEPTTEHIIESTTEEDEHFEPSETVIPGEEIKPTESLPISPTYATTKTQIFIPGDQPLGLAKSIAVVEAFDETTTYITSFLFGTVVNGQYTQLTQVASSTSIGAQIAPTSVSDVIGSQATEVDNNQITTPEAQVSTSETEAESTTEHGPVEKDNGQDKSPKINYITRIIPSTVYQTYTYFTTFFIPDGDKSTSIKSREVVTSEVRFITTSIAPPGHRSYSTVSPTEQTTTTSSSSYQTTSGESEPTTEETLTEPTPHLPEPAILNPTTEEASTEVMSTTEVTTTEKGEEEIEVLIKTLYTTYTYLTTFFQETTSSVKSREVVETNVVTTTIDSEFKATDPAVAGLLRSYSNNEKPKNNENSQLIEPSSEDINIEPTSTEFLKTYTYYTTVFVDGETLIESHTEVVTESIQPTVVKNNIQIKTASVEDNNVVPNRNDERYEQQKKKPAYGTISRPKILDKPTSEALMMAPISAALQSSIDDAYAYDTTMLRDDRIIATQTVDSNIPVEAVFSARDEELKKEAMQAIGMTPVLSDELVETMVTDVTSSSSGGSRRPIEEYESDPNDQISSESNTEEIEPSRTPTLVLQTSYTTYTYFTTVYKGPSSYVISRLDTVTNVVTETVRPTDIEAKLSPEEATLPITYFTTFTYWTTLYKGKSTMITSREETVSNVVTPTLPAIQSTEPVQITSIPTETPVQNQEISPTATAEVPIAPTTYYTTYTYFTTSYIGNETVINSHLETETNVVTPTAKDPETTETSTVEEIINSTTVNQELASSSEPGLSPTGLISTIRSSEINEGITTLFNTDVYGTYIDGLYAQVLESSTEIVAPSASSSAPAEVQPTGVVSINEGKIVDADGISTTLFTTKAIGTYIDNLYAQVIESTSSVIVDEEKKTATPHLPSTTIIGSKTYTTGLVRLIEGSIVKDDATTFYESRVVGTLIDGRYAQIIESTSSFKSKLQSTEMPQISPTLTPIDNIQPTVLSTSPSASVIESSQSAEDENDEGAGPEGALKPRPNFSSKTKASKASIRPFASRPRPTFLPKRKDPATTITRTSFTPTVTATPASKTKGFGSSRNRFAANRSKSSAVNPSADIKPTSSSSRRFGGSRTRGASSVGFTANRARPSSSARPTLSTSQTRRGGFNYRSTGGVRPTIGASSARFRIRPTQALGGPKASTTPSINEDINNDINQISTEEPSENVTAVDEEAGTTSAPTTTESPRRANNPLLRFRRPPILQRPSTTTTTSKPTTTAKRSSLLRRPDSRAVVSTTPRSRTAAPAFNRKPRPGNNLFPPRGLLKKPTEEPEEKEEEEEEEDQDQEEEQPEIDIQDNEYEGSETSEQHSSTTTEAPKTSGRRSKGINLVSIRPFARRPRTKRQAEYGSYRPKFRRNKSRTTAADFEEDFELTPEPPRQQTTSAKYQRSRSRSSYNSREDQQQQSHQQRERVRPSPVTNTPRHQFTLRERSQTTTAAQRSSYRRPTSSPRRRTEATTSGRIKAPKLRTQTTEASPRTTSRRFSSSSRGSTRTTSRSRYRDNNDFDVYSPPPFDGTITVTHKVPTEVTIPVVNGKNTEYKNVITAKPSFEVLGPYQYTTTTKDGKPIIQLTTELTSTLANGLMEVTKFLVYETPTTSVTFTPTTLRGRKTSFSHVVPSTVYDVRPEVSTVTPSLGNAPLANLLLSQLLLGNLGIPNTAGPQVPQSPTTEFKTKTTTYVTTVTSHTSTILPLTFRGKEITTTIVDSSVQVITATEYITETIVITPTAVVPAINNQLNTLLLPALLQAQLLQQNTPPPPQNNLQQFFLRDPLSNNDKLIDDDPDQRFGPRDDDIEDGERKIREYDEDISEIEGKPKKKGKIKLKEHKPPDKTKSSTVVTLYVSGKHPGEFTTLLSTVAVEDSSNLKKREVEYNSFDKNDFLIFPSRLPQLKASEEINHYYMSEPNDVLIESSEVETQTQESIKTKHLILSTLDSREIEETTTGHFLSQGPADSAPEQRTASTRSILTRNKRDLEKQPRRKRIRVRVPIMRYANETGEQPSESLKIEDYSATPENFPDIPQNHRRVRVIKKKLDQPAEQNQPLEVPKRKRILVKKTRLIEHPETLVDTPLEEDDEEKGDQGEESQTSLKRRRVLVTRKKIVPSETIEPTQKRRIKITRKRPVPTEVVESQIDITPTEITIFADSPMATLYNYHYSIPSDPNDGKVMVSELFMSGPSQLTIDDNDQLSENEGTNQDETLTDERDENHSLVNGAITNQSPTHDEEEDQSSTNNEEDHQSSTNDEEEHKSFTNDEEENQSSTDDEHENQPLTEEEEESQPTTNQGEENLTLTEEGAVQSEGEDGSKEYYEEENRQSTKDDEENKHLQEEEYENSPPDERGVDEETETSTTSVSEEALLYTEEITTPHEQSYDEATSHPPKIFLPSTTISTEPDLHKNSRIKPSLNSKSKNPINKDRLVPETTTQKAEDIEENKQIETTTDTLQQTTESFLQNNDNLGTSDNPDTSLPKDKTQSKQNENKEGVTDGSMKILPSETVDEAEETPIQYHYVTRLTTTTRHRTYTYVVTRVSGNEQIVTSSTAVKPDVRTVTVTDLVPITKTASREEEGRGFFLGEARYNLATKRMSNGVEVIVAGDKSTLPGQPNLRVVPTNALRPITLAPSTLTDHMMMLLPQESQKPHNEFVTKTYMTTYTYLTTFAEGDSTMVSSREKVISNVVTEEIKPSKTKVNDHLTLSASPQLTTGVYHTTYTYLNTLVDGELPLVVTSKKTIANTVTEQPIYIQPSEVPLQDTNTYLSTVAYTRTLSEGDSMQIISTEDVLTQVVITESDFIPSTVEEEPSSTETQPVVSEIKPTPITTDITKTYYATYTYYNTKVKDGKTVVETEVVTSSDVATETFTIQPKRPKPIEGSFETSSYNNDEHTTQTQPLNLYATKTYLTTFTYFTTLLQENKTPSIVVSSSTEVMQNIVTETVNPELFDAGYLNELRNSVNYKHEPVIATATLSDGMKMEITAMGGEMMKFSDKMDNFEVTSPSNIVTGSTIIFFDDDETDSQSSQSNIAPSEESVPSTTLKPTENDFITSLPINHEEDQDVPNQEKLTTVSENKPPVKNVHPFGSLGINGLNALGPVINAMADLFQSKFSSGPKNNSSKSQPVYRPQEEPPRPVYIPALDSEVAESQNIEGHNIYTDVHQRTKQSNIESALLSGGIPISPGQVITTNSDVIIGKHAVHGPRPPVKHFQKEVEGMKPPPPPSSNKPIWPIRDQERYPSAHIPHRISSPEKLPPRREPLVQPKPPQPLQNIPAHVQHNKNNYIDLRHEGSEIKVPSPIKHKPYDSIPQSSKPHDIFQKPHVIHKVPAESSLNRWPPLKERPVRPSIYPDDTTDLRPPAIQTSILPQIQKPVNSPDYIHDNKQPSYQIFKEVPNNQQNTEKVNDKVNDIFPTVSDISPNKGGEQPGLLVNIQPSQVANVIIPHGVSTALIYNKEPDMPSQKGEIFSEPSPYPDAEVGIGGVAGIIRPEEELLHAAIIPSNAVRMDVPVSPQGIGLDAITRLHNKQEEKKKNSSHTKKPIHKLEHFSNHGLNYMTPPPPPVSSLINYHLSGKEEIPDQEVEYSIKNEYHTEDDDEDLIQSDFDHMKSHFIFGDQNKGELPSNGDIHIISPHHFTNNSENADGVSFSVINSKPVILGTDTPESQPPIIKGRPGVSSFVNNSEATVSVGQMTNLKPNDDMDVPSNPLYNVHSTAIIRKPHPIDKHNQTLPRPFDNTVYTMNMDERPPLQDFKAHPQKINFDLPAPVDMELMRLTPRPVFDRNSEGSVVGLTPPAISHPLDTVTHRSTRRPPNRNRSPPPPPYKFERPVLPADKIKKPLLPDTERPPPPPVPTETLSPPKQDHNTYKSGQKNQVNSDIINYQQYTTSQPDNISPVLGGSLKVKENPQKPEVITADTKVIKSNNNNEPIKNDRNPEHSFNKVTPTYAKKNTVVASHTNELIIGSESFVDDATTTSTEILSLKTKPVNGISSSSTTVFFKPTSRTSISRFIKPTKTIQSHKTAIPLQINNLTDSEVSESMDEKHKVLYDTESEDDSSFDNYPNINIEHLPSVTLVPTPTTHVITHTQTLTVTTTESRVIQSKGQKPSTHTLVVTKTLTSTLLDTVTEVHTIVKPTSILSTVTTTIPQATTTVYPTVSSRPTTDRSTTAETKSDTNEKENQRHDIIMGQQNNNRLGGNAKPTNHNMPNLNDNDSILVVMTDKNTNHKLNSFGANLEPAPEIEGPEETNEVAPNVLLSGYLSQYNTPSQCKPECRATRNERCEKVNNLMRCVCRPGFARMFQDQPCKPTYTYSMTVPLERNGKDKLVHSPYLLDNSSSVFKSLADVTKESLHRMVMQSELRDVYHGLAITSFERDSQDGSPLANFYIQLSENFDDEKLMEVLKKYLIGSNFSIGGTELHSSRTKIELLRAEDFNECSDHRFNDCSEKAECFNLKGSYTCSCKEGYTDLSHNTLYPGRVCSADMLGCERCNYHGNCYSRNGEEDMCDCFHWYAGQYCQINLKVLLLILVLIGLCLGVLLVVCLVLSCIRQKPTRVVPPNFRLRPPPPSDKRAMISMDTASEASMDPPPFIAQPPPRMVERPKPCRKMSKAPSPPVSFGGGTLEQRDRSLTVMIPRAKYRPVPGSNLLTMSTFGPEQKLLKYLTPERQGSRSTSRKPSNSTNHSEEVGRDHQTVPKKPHSPHLRKPSTGALVSAGFEVSATVGRTKELQECYITEPHTDLGQPGFSTIRTADSSILVDIPPPPTLEAELLDTSKVDFLTVSEVRSYDETTIHPATKSLRIHYDKNDDSHTMVERDIGSTFIMPQSQLFKPARSNGSDISNFDSL